MNETQLSAADLLPLTQLTPADFSPTWRSIATALYAAMVLDIRANPARVPLRPGELLEIAWQAINVTRDLVSNLGGGVVFFPRSAVFSSKARYE